MRIECYYDHAARPREKPPVLRTPHILLLILLVQHLLGVGLLCIDSIAGYEGQSLEIKVTRSYEFVVRTNGDGRIDNEGHYQASCGTTGE